MMGDEWMNVRPVLHNKSLDVFLRIILNLILLRKFGNIKTIINSSFSLRNFQQASFQALRLLSLRTKKGRTKISCKHYD